MERGIVIIALKKKAYCYAAFNLALSIKHYNPNIHITLLSDNEHVNHFGESEYSVFDNIKNIPDQDYSDTQFEPALAKFNFYKNSPYEQTLYVDADSLCLKDIEPLMEQLSKSKGYFYSNVHGSGGLKDEIQYTVWATNQQVWDFFKLKQDSVLHNMNSSWIWVKRGKKADALFDKIMENYKIGFGLKNLLHRWGGTYPDELFFNGTCAQLKINPSFSDGVMFFGDKMDNLPVSRLNDEYYFMTLFGKGTGTANIRVKFIDYYDRLVYKMTRAKGIGHKFKSHGILTGKHVNK